MAHSKTILRLFVALLLTALCISPVCAQESDVYFNPQGGRHYHANARCESVGAAYLPLRAISLSDATSREHPYTPCPFCVAQTE